MKRFLLVLAIGCLAQSLAAQEYKDFGKERLNSSPRHGEWVDIKSGAQTIKAFVVYPERKDKAPAVLVVQEIFGLTDWLRSMCDELAEAGVMAIAPDLLNGQKFEDADGARKAISAVTQDQVKAVLDATVGLCSENSRVQRHACSVWVLPGWRMGLHLRKRKSTIESSLFVLRRAAGFSGASDQHFVSSLQLLWRK